MDKIVKLLIIVLALLPTISLAQNSNKSSCLELDIVLVGDLSGSCQGHEKYISDAFKAFINRFELSDIGIRIGIVTFSDFATLQSPLTSNKKQLYGVCASVAGTTAGGGTNMADALEMAGNQLIETDPVKIGRAVPKLIILITDGQPDVESTTASISEQLQKLMGIGVCGIFVQSDYHNQYSKDHGYDYLKSITSDFCRNVVSTNFELLAEEMKKLDICL